jgi:hypothetical protein
MIIYPFYEYKEIWTQKLLGEGKNGYWLSYKLMRARIIYI